MPPIRRTRRTPTRTGMGRLPGRERRGGYGHGAAAKKDNTMLIVGGGVGGLVILVILIAVAASGGGGPVDPGGGGSGERPVDVSGLEREGLDKCERGYTAIQECEGMMSGRALSASEKTSLRERLNRGVRLIREGLNLLEEANRKTNYRNKYDTTRYTKAQKAARMKLGELGG